MGIRTVFKSITETPTFTDASNPIRRIYSMQNGHVTECDSREVNKKRDALKKKKSVHTGNAKETNNVGNNSDRQNCAREFRMIPPKDTKEPTSISQTTDKTKKGGSNLYSSNDNAYYSGYTVENSKLTLINYHFIYRVGTSVLLFVIFVVIAARHPNNQLPPSTGLGDGKRSQQSSQNFFQSLDRDGDGVLKAQEVALFLEDSIGGTSFDTSSEVNEEVKSVMEDLDRDKDEGLVESDVYAYWNHLESLLTADEVKEWIENALQLPEYIGDIFKENGVTGYDFPELVENDGASLRDDLGISKPSFRKKILRHLHARLLGVGTVPDALDHSKISFSLESCSTVSFSWDKPNARGFPVHSYKVQRRDVDLHVSSEKMDKQPFGVFEPTIFRGPTPIQQWITVYNSGEQRFHDSSLKLGHSYVYRIQAWNSVGRSDWVDIDISKLLKMKRCTKTSSAKSRSIPSALEQSYFSNIFSSSFMIAEFVNICLSVTFTVFAVAAAIIRLNRASAPSTKISTSAFSFPVNLFIKLVNGFSIKCIGKPILPTLEFSEDDSKHDISVNAVGLHGYDTLKSHQMLSELDTPSQRRKKFKQASSERSLLSKSSNEERPDLMKTNSQRGKNSSNIASRKFFKIGNKPHLKDFPTQCTRIGIADTESSHQQNDSYRSSGNSSQQTFGPFDDYKKCNTCRKSYKVGKRWRHHCARCLATFCHKHGKVTHSNFTSCKVPGTCLCNICLKTLTDQS